MREYWVQQLVDAPNLNMQGLNTRKGGSAGEHCNGKQLRAESFKEQWKAGLSYKHHILKCHQD